MHDCICLYFFVKLDIAGLDFYGINVPQSLFKLNIQKSKCQQWDQNDQFCNK